MKKLSYVKKIPSFSDIQKQDLLGMLKGIVKLNKEWFFSKWKSISSYVCNKTRIINELSAIR